MNDYPCLPSDVAMVAADRRNAKIYAARLAAEAAAQATPPVARRLDSYSLADLYALEAQAVDLLAAIKGAIGDLIGPDDLAASVCGYDDQGKLLDAKTQHTFSRVRGRRG